jgi:predicted RNase H-like nuclease (RuvC/YqgF family)
MTQYGKIFLIGCDVNKCPGSVAKISRSLGARIVNPDHNLNHIEKIKIVDRFLKNKKEFIKIENKHEKDALAAALYGLKRINTTIKKISDHLKENNKLHLFENVKREVLLNNLPISEAVKNYNSSI